MKKIRSKKKKTNHCCELMDVFLEERKVEIYYNPVYREYYIGLESFPQGKHVIYHCPWCSYRFLPSLLNEFWDFLYKEHPEIEYNPCTGKFFTAVETDEGWEEVECELPEKFRTDKWWREKDL